MLNHTPRPGHVLLAGLALLLVTAACATDAETVNRVQPNLIEKAMFEGDWFVRQTITDVPPTMGAGFGAFVGATGTLEIIRWEIREDMLVGYRAYEKVPGYDSDADHEGASVGEQPVAEGQGEGYDPESYRDNPVVAYPITEHVDVRREYNPATGEQTNVIVEDTRDRPWYQRQFIRVDWNDPQVASFDFFSERVQQVAAGSYWVDQKEDSPDTFRAEKNEAGEVYYFDLSERIFVEPNIEDCYYSWIGDCTSGEVTVRTSVLKVDNARELAYQPLIYDDQRQGEFGLFRTERATYDRRHGTTYTGVEYLGNRHDIWQASVDADGKEIPFKERELRPIVYALSPNYPESMHAVTELIAKDSDVVFKKAAAFARDQSLEELEADLKAQTGNTCLFCLDLNEDGHARIGDLRYNFLYWVDSPQQAGPLGYGPSSAHPETGRIVAAQAFVYGAAVDTYAQRAHDMIALINGDLKDDDFLRGVDVGKQVASRLLPVDPRTMSKLATTKLGEVTGAMLGDGKLTRIDAVRQQGFPELPGPDDDRVRTILEREGMTHLLISDEMKRDYLAEFGRQSGEELTAEQLDDLSSMVLSPHKSAERRRAVRIRAEKRSLTLADYSDPAIVGLAKEVARKGLKGDALWQFLREQIYRGVMLHELGHTFGLRHNFGASSDALNFFPKYWELREKTLRSASVVRDLLLSNCAEIDGTNQAGCAAQRDGKMAEYQYSSIMDYHARFNADFQGFGLYDVAAIGAAYGDAVEVFEPAVVNRLAGGNVSVLRQAGDFRSPLFGQIGELVHYSRLPATLGERANLHKRKWLHRADYEAQQKEAKKRGDYLTQTQTPVRVPYVGCYDEYRDRTWFCHTWDMGADSFEIANYYVNAYEDDYYFNNFSRDRIGFGPFSVMQRVADRYFFPLNFAFQDAFYDLVYGVGDEYYQALSYTALTVSFNELWSVLSRPNYGSYNLQNNVYELVSYEQNQGQYSIAPGDGRSLYSRYDLDAGYNLIGRVRESGHFYEQLAALFAITSADASRLGIGRDVVGGDLAYRIPFYIFFDRELTQLFGSMYLEDPSGYGPRVVNGQLVPSANLAVDDKGAPVGTVVNTYTPWFIRIQSAIYSMAYFSSNFSLDYERRCQVSIEGSGDVLTPSQGYETVRFEDPTSGRTFLAYRDPLDTGRWPAAEKLDALNLEAAALAAMPQDTDEQLQAYANARASLKQGVEDLDIMRELFWLFGRSPI
jgi:hypothetical protein